MTTLPQLHPQAIPRSSPSTSRNPFARPKLVTQHGSFTRASILPSMPSPAQSKSDLSATTTDVLATPDGKATSGSNLGTTTKTRSDWRLLWRGGLEIGHEGWRLDGITFFALITFPPSTPSGNNTANPFDIPIQPFPTPTSSKAAAGPSTQVASPFPSFPSADTDLCLSLESMRGRKYLQVRGLTALPDGEVLDGAGSGEESGGVQMAISEQAPLLAAYFTGLLCRGEKLSSQGRTLTAIVIGLGDEGVDSTANSCILVYGQRQDHNLGVAGSQGTLRLCVARRKPPPAPPSAKKVRPGEPLPRAPLFFPAKAPKKPPPIFPSRSLSRTTSISSSIYHPPPPSANASTSISFQVSPPPAPVSGRTPGRRGEKRPRKLDLSGDGGEEERRRKTGRIVLDRERTRSGSAVTQILDEEDIFGKRAASNPRSSSNHATTNKALLIDDAGLNTPTEGGEELGAGTAEGSDPPNTGRTKRVRVSQQVLDNKAAIRKQTLILLEARGVSRTHDGFKDVFGMTTKGTNFAFRSALQAEQIPKVDIQHVINTHLDMYLMDQHPPSESSPLKELRKEDTQTTEDKVSNLEPEPLVKVEMKVKEEYSEVKLEGTFLHHHHERVKLQVVAEEDEAEDEDAIKQEE